MKLKVGEQLGSTVCATRVIVVRAGDAAINLTCGGAPMQPVSGTEPSITGTPAPGADGGTQLGKRYAVEELSVELLCTKAGEGTLAVDGEPIELKTAKPLPASD